MKITLAGALPCRHADVSAQLANALRRGRKAAKHAVVNSALQATGKKQ
jgi:hypothetical protein